MPSGPVDLCGSREFKRWRTSCSDVVMVVKVGTGCAFGVTGGVFSSGISRVDCVTKWLLRREALPKSSVIISPVDVSSGGIVLSRDRPVMLRRVS